MKIIAIDDYNRESIGDILICENVHKYYGTYIVKLLNEKPGDRFFKLIENGEKLYKLEP